MAKKNVFWGDAHWPFTVDLQHAVANLFSNEIGAAMALMFNFARASPMADISVSQHGVHINVQDYFNIVVPWDRIGTSIFPVKAGNASGVRTADAFARWLRQREAACETAETEKDV